MPEGPELHLASLYINRECEGVLFTGAVRKSEVSKNPDVSFSCEAYTISATSRGKEVKLTLTPAGAEGGGRSADAPRPMDIVFRFGMSGLFKMTPEDELPKHAHLSFYTKEPRRRVLSFVDTRRFGTWHPDGTWQQDRGPCVMFEYKSFRERVLSRLSDSAFDRPVCEVLLNQKYFNGIGNYLRAEILHRLNIAPFECARTVLTGLDVEDVCDAQQLMSDSKRRVKQEKPDLLRLCHTVPLEVVSLGGKGYDPEKADYSAFEAWLQCYYVDGMKSLRDGNGRTIWFSGDAGPMAPKGAKSPKVKKRVKKEENDHESMVKKPARRPAGNTTEKKEIKKETVNKQKIKKETVNKQAVKKENGSGSGKRAGKARETSPLPNRKSKSGPNKRSSRAAPAADSQTENRRVTRRSSR